MSTPTSTDTPPIESSDAAWATIDLSLPARRVAEELRDLEAVFRVNPFWVFSEWRALDSNAFHIRLRNESNDQELATVVRRHPGPGPGFTLTYEHGLKRRTVFLLHEAAGGSRLTIADDYDGTPAEERARRAAEVDRSLLAWSRALQRYLLRLKRWSWMPGWRWYMCRIWIPMKPSARRIVWLLYVITLAEFVLFLFVLLIYAIEQRP
ncbi:MAG: hypothetical protein ACLGHO_10125 [Gammaproteobacteria bacterium]